MDTDETTEGLEPKTDLHTMPIDVSKLPDLPPPSSRAWGRSSNTRRWRSFAYGLVLFMLVILVAVAFFSLRGKVWADYDEVCRGVPDRILVTVPEAKRDRLKANLAAYRQLVEAAKDPYPLIGSLVRVGRRAIADFGVSEDEVDELNQVMEEAFGAAGGGRD